MLSGCCNQLESESAEAWTDTHIECWCHRHWLNLLDYNTCPHSLLLLPVNISPHLKNLLCIFNSLKFMFKGHSKLCHTAMVCLFLSESMSENTRKTVEMVKGIKISFSGISSKSIITNCLLLCFTATHISETQWVSTPNHTALKCS